MAVTTAQREPTLAELRANAWKLSPDLLAEHFADGAWKAAPHHRVLARKVRECILKPKGRLIVSMPPRHGKSELISHWALVWLMQLRPSSRILFASYEASFAQEWGRQVRNTIEAHADKLGVHIAGDSSAQARWRTTEGGGMWTAGPGGSMTGRGADLLVIDDPHKNYAEAHSKTVREEIWNWYMSTARTRLQTGGSIIIVQTRWHEDDLTGKLLAEADIAGEQWEVVNMPAVAEGHEVWELGNGETWTREEGDPLWPEQYDEEALDDVKGAISSYLWAGLYQQRPAPPEGGLIKRTWWEFWSVLPARLDDQLISVDTTFKEGDGTDYVVMQCWARAGAEFFLLDQVRAHMDYPGFKKALKAFCGKHPRAANRVLIEESANGPAVIAELKKTLRGLLPRPAKGSKESRVHATSGLIEAGNVKLPDPQAHPEMAAAIQILMEESAEFPNGAHDDTVDGMTQALLEWTIQKTKGVRSKTPAGRGGRRRELPATTDLIGRTH